MTKRGGFEMKKALEYLKKESANYSWTTGINPVEFDKGHFFVDDIKKALKIAQQETAEQIIQIIEEYQKKRVKDWGRDSDGCKMLEILAFDITTEIKAKHCGGGKK